MKLFKLVCKDPDHKSAVNFPPTGLAVVMDDDEDDLGIVAMGIDDANPLETAQAFIMGRIAELGITPEQLYGEPNDMNHVAIREVTADDPLEHLPWEQRDAILLKHLATRFAQPGSVELRTAIRNLFIESEGD